MITVLIVEDNPGDMRLVRERLKETDPYQIKVIGAERLAEAIQCLAETMVDVILLDLSLPDVTGLETFKRMQMAAPNLPIVVLTGSYDEALALQAVRAGAQDYLLKQNLDRHLLARVLRYAIERKSAGEAVRNALVKEKELNELKSRFVSMVSHDFRTPLAAIQTSSDLLSNYGYRMTDEKKTQHFSTIRSQIKHLTGLLEDMLTYTKAEAVGFALNPVLTDFCVFCQAIVSEMRQLAGTREIRFVVNEPIESVEIDANLLRRALLNLLSNAVKYSPEGSVIELSISRSAEQIVLRIQDQGIGIPEDEQSHLFEVFHRANNVGNIPGTGLGLAIVKQAVEAHGGTITVDSQVNVGTAVTISIPEYR
jgi:signal transduction histidine kinase